MGELLQYVLMNIVGVGIVLYFFQASLNHQLDKRLAEFEAKHQVLEERRGEVIHQTYKRLAGLMRTLEEYTSRGQVVRYEESAKKGSQVHDAVRQLAHYVDDHRLYLSEELGASLEVFAGFVTKKGVEFSVFVVEAAEDEELAKKRTENWLRISEEVFSEGRELLKGLRKEFQEIIGLKS